MSTSPLKPFDNIGIAFSGGGFRAAAFALGTLSYLNRIGLDERISFSSSASGGSITNLLYTAYRYEGRSFADFYHKLIAELDGSTLLEQAVENLSNPALWNTGGDSKQRNLINAFSMAYDSLLFEGRSLDVYWPKKSKGYEVCLNTTEFYRGLSFRFQMSGKKDRLQVIGNKYLKIDIQQLEILKKIKLGDVLAASSCFPIGFEPIIYPRDFTHKHLSAADLRRAILFENYKEEVQHMSDPGANLQSFGFMDGGITDNQGLKSAMLADQKRQNRAKPDPFDLIIVTDVASYFMDSYAVPVTREKPVNTVDSMVSGLQHRVRQINVAEIVLLFPSLMLILLYVFCGWTWSLATGCSLATLFFLVFAVRQIGVIHLGLRFISDFNPLAALNSIFDTSKLLPQRIVQNLVDFISAARLSMLIQMLEARATSVVSMVSDINLKQVRRLIYEMFYESPCWDNRRVPNFIYELSSYNSATRTHRINSKSRLGWTATEADKTLLLENLDAISPVAEEARTMGTTLWFSEAETREAKLKKLIVTGQVTTCMNLLEYVISLERKRVPIDEDGKKIIQKIKTQLVADLGIFKNDPYFLYQLSEAENH